MCISGCLINSRHVSNTEAVFVVVVVTKFGLEKCTPGVQAVPKGIDKTIGILLDYLPPLKRGNMGMVFLP